MIDRDWKLILRGLFIAAVGAAALMLLIVSLSAGYFGRFSLAASLAFFGCCCWIGFRRWLGPFLDVIDQRDLAITAQLELSRNQRPQPPREPS